MDIYCGENSAMIKSRYVFAINDAGIADLVWRDRIKYSEEFFDAFADKFEVANESFEIAGKRFGDIIKPEMERINAK
jgi:hypothetical protein